MRYWKIAQKRGGEFLNFFFCLFLICFPEIIDETTKKADNMVKYAIK